MCCIGVDLPITHCSCRFLVLGAFGSLCDVALLPTAQDLPPSLLQIGDVVLSSGSMTNISAVVQSCFSSTSLLPALGIDLSDQFALDTAPLLSEATPQMIADLSGPVMAEALVALDEATAGLVENEVAPAQLEMLSQACQQCNITQWSLTLQSLGFNLPICGQITCDQQPAASTCQTQFCDGKQFGDATDALINATLINVGSVREQLTLLNVTLGLTEEFVAALPLAVDGFISGASAKANAISCSFVKHAYTQSADGLCRTAIDGYQTATNSVLGAAMVLSVMVCVQIVVNIRLGGVGSGPPPVRVRSEDVFAVPGRPSIQLGGSVKSDEKAAFRSDSQSTEDSEFEEQ